MRVRLRSALLALVAASFDDGRDTMGDRHVLQRSRRGLRVRAARGNDRIGGHERRMGVKRRQESVECARAAFQDVDEVEASGLARTCSLHLHEWRDGVRPSGG